MNNPVVKLFKEGMDKFASCDPKYPLVCSTYRVTEHWQTGVLTRWLPWLIEAEPQMFCELSEELGKLKGIKNGERVMVSTHRGQVEGVAIVTSRLKPFKIAGQEIHQIGLPYHYGWLHPKDGGDSANLLTPTVGDPNTMIPESKAFMANVTKLTKQPAKKVKKG
jgi:formate dehydrogenase major subunit